MKILQNILIFFFLSASFIGFSQSNTYIYQEEFESTNNWTTGDNTTRSLSVYGGRYYFEHKRTTDSWRVSTKNFDLSDSDDFEIETSIQKISGVQDYGMSFLYDFKDENNYKEFGITATGYFRVAESVSGTYSTLKAWEKSSNVKTGNYATNILKIVKKGTTVTFYVNGSYVYSTSHKSVVGKKLALQLYKNQKISIDYLRVIKTNNTVTKITTGETILFDGFNNNENNWALENSSDVSLEVRNGGYDFDHKRTEGGWNSTIETKFDTNRDFYITASFLKVNGAQDRGFGLIFGRKDNDNQNEFIISGNGMYYINKIENGTSSAVQSWTSESSIKQGDNTYNYLKVEKTGSALKYYINNALVYTQYNTSFYGERTGFIVYGKQKISITYLSMKYTDAKNNNNYIDTNNNINNITGESILFDDFNSNANNWSDTNDSNHSFYVTNGKYYLDHKRDEKGWLSHIKREFDSSKDFEIESKLQHVSGDTNSPYGMLWGKKDYNYFQFLIAATGYYKVRRVVDNKGEDIIKWTKTSNINAGVGGENTLRIKREGDYYKFYINNNYITRIDFEKFYGDEIGFGLYFKQKVAIDYISIKGLKENTNNIIVTNNALKVPLYDDFSSNTNNWNLENADDYSLDLSAGKLIMHRKKSGGIFISRDVDIDDSKDFIIESKIGEINTSTGWYGITFGRKTSSNEFSFLLSGNGNYKFRKFDNDVYKEIIPLTFAAAIKTGSNAENVVKIVKSGSLIRFYINNTYVNEAPFEKFFGNKFGYTIYYDRKIAVDYLDIKYQTESYNNPPVIVITEPFVEEVRGFKIVEAKNITVKGKATDADGIYEITINGKEASVSADGTFVANVPLGYGKNDLIVKATDVKQASSTKSFVIKRNSPEIINTDVTNNDSKETLNVGFGKYYALIIGVSEYDDDSIQDLNGEPVKDAQALADVLVANYSFDKQNVTVLKNPKENEIIKEFYTLKNKITKNDNLVIFYAGHGNYDKVSEKGYWMPSDAEMEFEGNVILNTSIVSYIKAINSRHTLLIADACFSGSILVRNRDFKEATKAVQKKYELPSRKAITSGTLTTVPNESVFMKYLLKRLKDNADKYISAGQLFNMIEDPVINNTTGDNQPQYAPIANTGDEGGDFIFIKR